MQIIATITNVRTNLSKILNITNMKNKDKLKLEKFYSNCKNYKIEIRNAYE